MSIEVFAEYGVPTAPAPSQDSVFRILAYVSWVYFRFKGVWGLVFIAFQPLTQE